MDSKYLPALYEKKIYQFWEKKGFFKAKVSQDKKPFCIILPPPNANADLHLGHAMYVYEDIMIRYQKLRQKETLWLPGADHAGFETQYVFEKELQKQNQTRFDFDRDTLYQKIWDFVINNKSKMENQLRQLGFSLDWEKEKFTLDLDIVKIVYQTFKKLFDKKLVYRAKRLVNYCPFCGTSFSDLEVIYKERKDPLFYIKYSLKDSQTITVATTRPETMFGDTALAVNPNDKRYKNLIGKTAIVPLTKNKIPIIGDQVVDLEFGSGAVKVTPAHDFTDFEIASRHDLPIKQVINFDGRLNELTGKYKGLFINQARKTVIEDLKKENLIEKINEDYCHRVATCYKCGRLIEPLPKEQWFIKIRPLAYEAKKLVKNGKIKIYPRRFKKILIDWLDNFHDWNISRQVVWGIRIPAYRCNKFSKDLNNNYYTSREEQLKLKNRQWFVSLEKPKKCLICGGNDFVQDEDTFDTWFSSAQWPFATLLTIDKEKRFYNYFYPTSVMETGYDILPWWVARMIMIGYFATGKVPFYHVFLHGLVRDKSGKKMSKSKGNVINPIAMVDKYGADALRAALIFGVKEGNDVIVSEEKIIGMRNFTNKIWNIGRFIWIKDKLLKRKNSSLTNDLLGKMIKEFAEEKKQYLKLMENYQFSKAFDKIYNFLWHRLADFYIEKLKAEINNGNIKILEKLKEVYFGNLIMVHPFIPFVTEAIWQSFFRESQSILNQQL